MHRKPALISLLLILACCDAGSDVTPAQNHEVRFEVAGALESPLLNEASGIQSGRKGEYFLHNDDGGSMLHVIDQRGRRLGLIAIRNAKNKDWEDITSAPSAEGRLLVIGDIGDNHAGRKSVKLYFIEQPTAGDDGVFPKETDVIHKVKLRYPDGSRDCESMAFDPHSRMILFLTKRDKPPRLYGVKLDEALANEKLELQFLGEGPHLRPPGREDFLWHSKKGAKVSWPTGMDISADGEMAAIITYRSLYLFRREPGESWVEAFRRQGQEFVGPPGSDEEAVTFTPDGRYIIVTTEERPAPIYRIAVPE
jgi:hypothetical protein